jgi:hypothetical protein
MAMMLPEGFNRRYASIAAILLVFIWLWVALDRPYSFPKHIPWNTYANAPQTPTVESDAPSTSIDTFDQPLVDSQAIRNMCGGTVWNASLVFECDNSVGNVGNVRTSMLTCVRYAITAGAAMVLPRIINGDGEHHAGTTLLDWDRQPFGFFFDQEHFIDSMKSSCPEMKIYTKHDEIKFPDNYVHPPRITIVAETIGQLEGEDWRTAFYKIVEAMITPDEDTFPIVIEMALPAPVYDVYSDGNEFAHEFGNLIKFRPDVRAFAAKILLNLGAVYNTTFDLTQHALYNFFGTHLFTEESRLGPDNGWPGVEWEYALFDRQVKNIKEAAVNFNSTVLYLASQRNDEIAEFAKDAQMEFDIHTKYSLLSQEERKLLLDLTLEQQNLVDYLVLLKASHFVGVGHSSFAWNVALKRHIWAADEQFTSGSHTFEDRFSHIYGWKDGENPHGDTAGKGMNLYHNIWP